MLNIKKLLTKILNSLASKLVDYTPSSSVASSGTIRVAKRSGIVQVRIQGIKPATAQTAGSTLNIYTLPTAYRPVTEAICVTALPQGHRFAITTSGAVQVTVVGSTWSTAMYASLTFVGASL